MIISLERLNNMVIINDPANDVSIDIRFADEEGDGWLEVRNDDMVIKRFRVCENYHFKTDVIESRDKTKIINILNKWIKENV